MQQVIDGLWIGDYQASQDSDSLAQNGIGCIVSASESLCVSLDSLGPDLTSPRLVSSCSQCARSMTLLAASTCTE